MTQLQPVTVTILDKTYRVACPAAERANLESAARFLDGKMREIRDTGKVFGLERIAVLAALNISNELLQNQPGNAGNERAPREEVGDLLERIDRELHGEDPVLRRQRLAEARQQEEQQQQAATQPGRVVAPTPAIEQPQQQEQLVPQQQQVAPWEQQAVPQPDYQQPQQDFQPEPSWNNGASFAPENDNQDDWNNGQPVPQQGWGHDEENGQGNNAGFIDGGPNFQLPPQN